MKVITHFLSHPAHSFLDWRTFQTKIWRKSKYTFYCRYIYIFENLAFYEVKLKIL